MNHQRMILTAAAFIVIGLCGCGPRDPIVRNYYLIEAAHPAVSDSQTPCDVILMVRPFTIGVGYQSRGLVYDRGGRQFERDFYHEYFVSPSQMITEQTQMWLADSGLFVQVPALGTLAEPTYLLEGDIRRLCYDVRSDDDLKAVLEVTVYLLGKQPRHNYAIEFTKNYRITHPFDKNHPQQAVDAMGRCLAEMLQCLEKDLTQYLNSN